MTITVAHATWFIDHRAPVVLDLAIRPLPLALVLIAVTSAVMWRRIAGRLPGPELRLLRPLGRIGPWVPRLLAAHAGLSLLAMAVRGEYLAPSLLLQSSWPGLLLTALETVVGVWLITGIRVRAAAWLLVAAGPLGMFTYGLLPLIERLDLLGIAVFLVLMPPDDSHRAGRVSIDVERVRLALFGLRSLVGTALIVVAFTEKLASPGTSLEFLQGRPFFNVAQLLGLPVSDELFVQFAGGIEILIGLLLISGATPQITSLLAVVPFSLPLLFLGPTELVGHLPIYGVLLAMVVFGSRPDTAPICRWLPSVPRASVEAHVGQAAEAVA